MASNKTELFEKLKSTATLPSPSRVALEVMRLCYSEDSSLQDVARAVQVDPALSARLLKYANSALFVSPEPVASVQQAAVRIGMRGIVNMALGISLISAYMEGDCISFDYDRFWSKSLARAVAARHLAEKSEVLDPDEAFTCGLLSHIGELALASAFADDYSEILRKSANETELLRLEAVHFGLDHHELTSELIGCWGIPDRLCKAIAAHHALDTALSLSQDIARNGRLFFLAHQVAEICLMDLPLNQTFEDIENLASGFTISAEGFGTFFDQVVFSWQQWGDLFHIPTRSCPEYRQLRELARTPDASLGAAEEMSQITILAVDDDPLTLLSLERLLANEQRTILTAEDGKQALEVVRDAQPDMLITDWRMPRLDGLELCRTLRNSGQTRHMYIIMLTGLETDDELVRAFEAGADDYVVKPFTAKVLDARVRSGERIVRYQQTIVEEREVVKQYVSKLAEANIKLQTLAMTDALTGLPNRRSAMSRMKDVLAESTRFNEELSCILIDIDHFKEINDTHGHDSGDIVLKKIAQLFHTQARRYDTVSRIGGEEFLIISGRSGRSDVLKLANRLREEVEKFAIPIRDNKRVQVTISLGVSTWLTEYSDERELITAADRALYAAKNLGRNQVVAAWDLA